jgi:C1A family cysteine protease
LSADQEHVASFDEKKMRTRVNRERTCEIKQKESRHQQSDIGPLVVRNQGGKGTCVANGTLESAGYLWVRDNKEDPELSRLFLYYVGRQIEGVDPTVDSGLMIRDGVKALQTFGACPEALWPYSDDDTTFTTRPSAACFESAAKHEALFFYRCPDLATIKASIAQGFPVIMGFDVPDNFMGDECAKTGEIKTPTAAEGFQGGHCMVFAEYNDATKQLGGPNSWGEDWGDKGWFHMPYEMIEEGFVSDCWSLRRVQE